MPSRLSCPGYQHYRKRWASGKISLSDGIERAKNIPCRSLSLWSASQVFFYRNLAFSIHVCLHSEAIQKCMRSRVYRFSSIHVLWPQYFERGLWKVDPETTRASLERRHFQVYSIQDNIIPAEKYFLNYASRSLLYKNIPDFEITCMRRTVSKAREATRFHAYQIRQSSSRRLLVS